MKIVYTMYTNKNWHHIRQIMAETQIFKSRNISIIYYKVRYTANDYLKYFQTRTNLSNNTSDTCRKSKRLKLKYI